MAFTSWNNQHLSRFNSGDSADFLSFYESYVDSRLKEEAECPPHKTFAASSFRCDRRSWFRLRGTTPDSIKVPDRTLAFTADMGTACHRIIQSNLKDALGKDWINVQEYLNTIEFPYSYTVDMSDDGLEALVEITDPYPIRFACDGVIRWKNKLYLLEIKTSMFSSWDGMLEPRDEHVDQVRCYATLLNLDNILFLYQDRQYGQLKCYEEHNTLIERDKVIEKFRYVMNMANKNLAPPGLPVGDKWCSPSMCPYYQKCQEYGR